MLYVEEKNVILHYISSILFCYSALGILYDVMSDLNLCDSEI